MKKLLFATIIILMALSFVLSGCTPAPAQEVPPAASVETQEVASVPEATTAPTDVPPTAEPTAVGPQVGGKMVIVLAGDATTFDIQKMAGWGNLTDLMNATLVTMDPNTHQFAPYIAESWTISEDGLVYTFKLRQDVKFSNGDPLTAQDFIYTIQRALDPEIASPASSALWVPAVSYEAVDDYTLKLTLALPNYTFLLGLSGALAAPVSQRAVEEEGESYGMNPVSTGPYLFKEYEVGEKVVLERNPDYVWGPSWTHGGPAYIQTIEFRIIPEYATQIAGLESGEIDMLDVGAEIQYADLPRIRDDGRFQILERMDQGMWPFVEFNVSKPPFDDIRLRKAFNLALDRQSLVDVVLQGNGKPLYGPLTEGTIGYDPIVETLGYHYDLEQAKELMQEAGYTYDADGMLVTPDGQPFVLDFYIANGVGRPQLAQVLADQYKTLGVTLNMSLEDWGLNWQRQISGDYNITIGGLMYFDAEVMYLGLHSSMLGAINGAHVNDPALDEILNRTRSEIDSTARQAAITEAQKHIIEQAYIAPIYTALNYYALDQRVQGLIYDPTRGSNWFEDAYIVEP
jgi:peptide/nickel transport system substrate-binding protein